MGKENKKEKETFFAGKTSQLLHSFTHSFIQPFCSDKIIHSFIIAKWPFLAFGFANENILRIMEDNVKLEKMKTMITLMKIK